MNKKLEQDLEPDKSSNNVLKNDGCYDEILKLTLLNLKDYNIRPFVSIREFITADIYVVDFDTHIIISEASSFVKENLPHYLKKEELKKRHFVNLYKQVKQKDDLINVIYEDNLKLVVLNRYNKHRIKEMLLKRLEHGYDKKK